MFITSVMKISSQVPNVKRKEGKGAKGREIG
jgi:hypothetical protein